MADRIRFETEASAPAPLRPLAGADRHARGDRREIERLARSRAPPTAGAARSSCIRARRAPGSDSRRASASRSRCCCRRGDRAGPPQLDADRFLHPRRRQRLDRRARVEFARYDVWNHPSWPTYVLPATTTRALQARLTYSNAALLEQLDVHLVESRPAATARAPRESAARARSAAREPVRHVRARRRRRAAHAVRDADQPAGGDVARRSTGRGEVEKHLLELESLGRDYVGRRLYLLHNPITGRTNGTTPSFFATMTIRPPGIVDRPHRHSSAAINYYFQGRGREHRRGTHRSSGRRAT